MLEDIRKDTVTFQPNFDDSEQEPTVLPSRLNLLLNGSDGIAVGMATRIPPHNLTEVASAIHLHVERVLAGEVDADGRPLISIKEYMDRVQGRLPNRCQDSRHRRHRGHVPHGQGTLPRPLPLWGRRRRCSSSIVVHEIPYQVKKAAMLEHIADLVSKDAVVGIRDIRDESSKEGIRVVIEVKTNADPHGAQPALRLQPPSRILQRNMMAIVDGRPCSDPPHMLHVHVAHREQGSSVVLRARLSQARPTSLRAWLAQQRIDDVVAAGKASRSRDHFESVLRGEETMRGSLRSFPRHRPSPSLSVASTS